MAPKRLGCWINQRPLFVYGSLYAFVTMIFAVMYWMMPGAFYHATAVYEPMLKRDENLIRSGLEKVFQHQGLKNNGSEIFTLNLDSDTSDVIVTFPVHEIKYPINTFTVHDLLYENGSFKISTTMYGENTCAAIPSITITAKAEEDWLEECSPEEVIVAVEFVETVVDAPIRSREYEGSVAPAPPPRTPSPYDLFITLPRSGNRSYLGFIKMPRALFEMMNAYADAKDGFAGLAQGSFWRMLYLSTVTITTLGYGDIVPITPASRALVGAEAVVGILVIGLYLNALSQRLVSDKSQAN